MEYREIEPASRQQMQTAAAAGDERGWVEAMLSLARFEPDTTWIEAYLLERLAETSHALRWGAVQALAELARRGGISDKELVITRLRQAAADAKLGGIIEDAIDDIEMFGSR